MNELDIMRSVCLPISAHGREIRDVFGHVVAVASSNDWAQLLVQMVNRGKKAKLVVVPEAPARTFDSASNVISISASRRKELW